MSNIEWTGPRQRVATLATDNDHQTQIERLTDEQANRVRTEVLGLPPLPSFAQERVDRATLRAAMLLFAHRYSALELDLLHDLAQKDLAKARATGGEA